MRHVLVANYQNPEGKHFVLEVVANAPGSPTHVLCLCRNSGDTLVVERSKLRNPRVEESKLNQHQVNTMLGCHSVTQSKGSPDVFADIKAFHEKFGLAYDGPPRKLEAELLSFRMKFIEEEFHELVEATTLDHQLDACIDLIYVILGYCYLRGWDAAEAWRRVQAANMAKVRAEKPSDSKRGTTFDVVKPVGWTAPNLSDLV